MRIITGAAIAAALATLVPTTVAQAETRCATRVGVLAIVRMQERWLAALLAGDKVGFDGLTADDFRFVERGRELDRDQLYEMVRDVLRNGTALRWSVTRPRVDLDCSLAVLNYVNDGSVSQAGGSAERVRWLETAVLRRSRGGWLVSFASSERMAADAAGAPGGVPSDGVDSDRQAVDAGTLQRR